MTQNEQLPFVFGENSASAAGFTVKCPECLPPEPIFIDEDGDLTLQVGEYRCLHVCSESQKNQRTYSAFKVCPKTLARSSPVMKKMLYGGFAESKKPGDQSWTVRLPEDNPEALEVLLNIIHCRFDRVPSKTISIDDLYNITVLTDKYDLTRVLQPWVGKWKRGIDIIDQSSLTASLLGSGYLEKRLWIAWELGDLKDFELVTNWIASICSVNSRGASRSYEGKLLGTWFHNLIESPDMHDVIVDTRMRKINDLLEYIDEFVTSLIQPPPSQHFCTEKSSSCEAVMLGSVIRSLSQAGLWPIPTPAEYKQCSSHLLHDLKSLTILTELGHYYCEEMVDLWRSKDITEAYPQLSDMHKRHCLEQEKKSGLELSED